MPVPNKAEAPCVRSHEYFNNCACRLFVETPRGRRVFTGRLNGHLESVFVIGRPSSRRAELVEAAIRNVEEVAQAPTNKAPSSKRHPA